MNHVAFAQRIVRRIGGVLGVLLLVAGCASGPGPDRRPVPGVPGSFPDKDGAPIDAPPNLASLPDPVPRIEPIRSGGPNKPYTVLGQSYEPVVGDIPWKETGTASWYGTKFHGRRTASGELYSVYGLTAAHRTLPIPSYARVKSLKTGKSVIVRINDRGPFHSSRVIDLSYAAAVKLGIERHGNSQVEVERLTFDDIRAGSWQPDARAVDPVVAFAPSGALGESAPTPVREPMAPETKTLPPPSDVSRAAEAAGRAHTVAARGFWVQLAALARQEGVDRMHKRVSTDLSSLLPMLAVFHEAPYYKLQVGPYATRSEAHAAAERARHMLQIVPMVIERR
ncbi:MAG: septal ring lytic transglycosylase RlpA family protein [Aquabacterium sp.]|uniref:septal ring lytic transglycosylase RlpA family protein n=1 Tax=Aquabacterium sp. TaxID=1872578 RepID=UPI003BCBB9C0